MVFALVVSSARSHFSSPVSLFVSSALCALVVSSALFALSRFGFQCAFRTFSFQYAFRTFSFQCALGTFYFQCNFCTFSFQCAFALVVSSALCALLVSSARFALLVSSVSHVLFRVGGLLHAPHIYFMHALCAGVERSALWRLRPTQVGGGDDGDADQTPGRAAHRHQDDGRPSSRTR